MARLLVAFALSLMLSGCVETESQKESATPARIATASTSEFDSRLLEIARTYESYGRNDTEFRVAPALCRPFVSGTTPLPRFSSSEDSATHGRKLYSLFIKEKIHGPNDPRYTQADKPNPVGQVVVKEAWVAEEISREARTDVVSRKVVLRRGDQLVEMEDRFRPYAVKDGRIYHAKQKSALFVMLKLDPKTPGTDDGWVYGTVTADGDQVTSAGQIESCMSCHKDAPFNRLFGLPNK